MEREGGNGKIGGEIYKMAVGEMDRRSLRYLVGEELQRKLIRVKEGKRVWDLRRNLNKGEEEWISEVDAGRS